VSVVVGWVVRLGHVRGWMFMFGVVVGGEPVLYQHISYKDNDFIPSTDHIYSNSKVNSYNHGYIRTDAFFGGMIILAR
jgi:hypothetical protein